MTQNKFWLVLNQAREVSTNKHITENDAIAEANELAFKYPQDTYFVVEAVRSFKADVSVVETDLIIPEVEPTATETLTPKFKVGDKVKVNNDLNSHLKYYSDVWTIDSFEGGKVVVLQSTDNVYTHRLYISEITLAE